MAALRRSPRPLDWRQLASVGEQLLDAESLEAQTERIISGTKRLVQGEVQVWLQEDLFRLPDRDAQRLFPNHPPSDGMRRAVKSNKMQVKSLGGERPRRGVTAAVPLSDQGFILGALQVSRPAGPRFRTEELNQLEGLARMISVGLFAAHRVEVERFRLGQLNLVRQVSSQIANVMNVDELSLRVTELIQKTFNYYYVAIFTLKPDSRKLRFRSSASAPRKGRARASISLEVEIGQGLIGEAAARGEQIVCDDVRLDSRFRFLDSLPETRSEVVIPLKIEGNVLGILDVQSNQLHAFHPNDLLILNALADNVARAVEGARVYSDLRRRADQLTLVAEVSRSVTSTLDLNQFMTRAAELIHERFGYQHVSLYTVHPNRRLITYEAGSGKRTKKMVGMNISLDEQRGIIPQVARTGKAILANDVSREKSYTPSSQPPVNTRSELTVPLSFNDRVLGVLDIQSDRLNAFTEDDQVMFEAVADTMAAAIRNADLYESEIWRRQVSESLREVAGLLSAHVGVHQVLEAILVELERNLPVDVSAIWLMRGERLVLAAAHGAAIADMEKAGRESPTASAALYDALHSASPLIRKAGDAVLPSEITAGFHHDYSALMVPMRLDDQPVGLITLAHRTPSRYGHEAQAMTTTFASYAAVAIENARLYDAAQEQAYVSAALLQVAQALVSSNDLNEILVSILRLLPILIGVKRGVIYFWGPEGNTYSPAAQYGFFEGEMKKFIERQFESNSFPLLERAREKNRIQLFPSNSVSNPLSWLTIESTLPDGLDVEATTPLLWAVPLSIKNDHFGVMLLEEPNENGRFLARRLEIISGVAQQIALAIQNDRLQDEIVARERLETEATLARQIQKSFIPESMPHHPSWQFAARWRTARQVGGDFYDVIELPDNKIGLFIADVADKGMPAALFMALTRTLMRAAILETESPEEAFARVNQLLLPDTRQGMFVTAVYAVLDLDGSECVYVNAGHNPPLFRHADGQLERLTRTGVALGIMEQPVFTRRTVKLEVDDVLFFYTDGVTDSMALDGEFFGEQRLQQSLMAWQINSSEALLDLLEKQLVEFTAAQPAADDLTMLAIRRLKG